MTRIAIIYKSITGNTKLIAEAIREQLNPDDIVYFGEPNEGIEADIYIIGSWTDKGSCSKEIKEFLESLSNKKIAYFGTAGFGGNSDYYKTLFSRVRENIDISNQILGCFFCQGKMPIRIRERYEQLIKANPEDKNLEVSIENFDDALEHPNDIDVENAKSWVDSIINKIHYC